MCRHNSLQKVKKCAGHFDRPVPQSAGQDEFFYTLYNEKLCARRIFPAGHLDRVVLRTCRSKRKFAG